MKRALLLSLLTVLFLNCFAQVNAGDSLALVDLYDSCDGVNWVNHTNWLTTQPVSAWEGINVQETRVHNISLDGEGLREKIPESFGNLTGLIYLYLSDNQITALPNSIGNLSEINFLSLQFNKLTYLPESFGNLTNLLIYLQLDDNELTSLPVSFGNITAGQILLQNNKLVSLPQSIGDLKYVNLIRLDNNKLTSLPESIGKLALNDLYVSGNKLTSLPASIGKIRTMQYMDISNNNLTSLPNSIDSLKNLFGIDLSHNELGNFENNFTHLDKLQYLYLNDNNISRLPAFLQYLPELKSLKLNNNQLTSLPQWFSDLSRSLEYLELSENGLSKLPSSIGDLHKLSQLNVSHNSLTMLPSSFSGLTKLSSLDISYNQFTDFPFVIRKLSDDLLDHLFLDHNKLQAQLPFFLHKFGNSDHSPVSKVNVSYNNYTFDAGEFLICRHIFYDSMNHSSFSFSPQANIPLHITGSLLSVNAGGTLSNNTYHWYRNNILHKTIVGDSTFAVDSAGTYFVKVNNAVATALTLMSDSIVIIAACSTSPSGMAASNIQQTAATLNWNAAQGATQYQVQHKLSGAASFATTTNVHTSFTLRNLTAGQTYVWRVRSQCPLGYSVYSATDTFKTATGLQEKRIAGNVFSVYPNPATSILNINFYASVSAVYELSVYDLEGKKLLGKNATAEIGTNNAAIDIHSLPAGMYLLKLRNNNADVMVEKIVKQ